MNKKAMELSINFFVLLVLALVAFGYSVTFLYDLFGKVSELEKRSFDQLDQQVAGLTCGAQQVCLSTTRETITRGSFKVFGLRVMNSKNEPTDFDIKIEQTIAPAGQTTDLFFKPLERKITQLGTGDVRTMGIGVEIPADAKSGNYVLNVKVTTNDLPYGDQNVYKLNIAVP